MSFLTIFSVLYNSDEFIDHYLSCLQGLELFSEQELKITFYLDTNSEETLDKLIKFSNHFENTQIIFKRKSEDKGLYYDFNDMIRSSTTKFVMNYNPDDYLHPQFLKIYWETIQKNPHYDLFYCPINVSYTKNERDFSKKYEIFYDKKKIFVEEKDTKKKDQGYDFKVNLLKECVEKQDEIKTIGKWVPFETVDIFDFFRIDYSNFINIFNYHIFGFSCVCPVWKKELFNQWGEINHEGYGLVADAELWIRFFTHGAQFYKIQEPLIIYYNCKKSLGHSKEDKTHNRKLIKDYHPLFKMIHTIIDIVSADGQTTGTLKEYFDIQTKSFLNISEMRDNTIGIIGVTWSSSDVKIEIPLVMLENQDPIIQKEPKTFWITPKILKNINGICHRYNGEATLEKIDFMYRLFFETLSIQEIPILKQQSCILTQQIINYNLYFFFTHPEKFAKGKKEIMYRDEIFFIEDDLGQGTLFDIFSKKKIYQGTFTHYLPHGKGEATCPFTENKFSGYWLNGYCYETDCGYCSALDPQKSIKDMCIYKKWVYQGYHDEKQDPYSLCLPSLFIKQFSIFTLPNIPIQQNSEPSIKVMTKRNNQVFYYLENHWQEPVITEKKIYEIVKNHNDPGFNYIAFPWATLIDQLIFGKTELLEQIQNTEMNSTFSFVTTCQHIYFRKILPIFKKCGVKYLFVSHRIPQDDELEKEYSLKIIPFFIYPLYATPTSLSSTTNRKYLCSFKGNINNQYYLTNIRERLADLKEFEDCWIEFNHEWFFEKEVYHNQIHKKNVKIDNEAQKNSYIEIISNSEFSLCPSGSGPNSIRLWESLSYSSIPIILSNHMVLPEIEENWQDVCVFWSEQSCIKKLYFYLKTMPLEKIQSMKKLGRTVYEKYLFQENFAHLLFQKMSKEFTSS